MKQSSLPYISVGIGGMIGATLRYAIEIWMGSNTVFFPWDTLTVNISGAFLLSLLLFSPVIKKHVPPVLFTGITTGVLGAYTTFSTLIIEIVHLFENHIFIAAAYLLISFFGGLISSFAGYKIARSLPAGDKVYD